MEKALDSLGRLLQIMAVIALLLTGCTSEQAPRSYEDCMLQNLKGVTLNSAVASIRTACRKKFPTAGPVYAGVEVYSFANASVEELENALLEADRVKDKEAACTFAGEIRRRQGIDKSVPPAEVCLQFR